MTGKLSSVGPGDWVVLGARQHPDRPCFVDGDGRSLGFGEVNDRVNRLANALADRGATKGERIAFLATDSIEYVEALLACMKLGATFVPLNYRLAPHEVRTLLATAGATWMFAGDRYLDLVAGLRADLPALAHVVALEGASGGEGGADTTYDELLAAGRPGEPGVTVDDEDILGLAFTSGTTGLPKGVLQSARMIRAFSFNGALEYRFRPAEFRYSAAPLYHVAGLGYVIMAIARGSTSLILPQFDPDALVGWLQTRVTGVFLVPTMVSTLLRRPDIGDSDYPQLTSLIYGAAPMSPTLLRRAMDTFGCDFYNGFGAGTEAGMQSVLPPEEHRRALAGEEHLLGSIGKPGFGIDLRLVGPDFQDVPRGEVGEIVTRSEMVMSGYLDRPDLTAQAVVDGWFRAGDMAWMDDEGYLYLAGRKNDMIIRGGENIYPIEIESTLAEHPSVLESAVVGAPDEHWGEVVHAHLVARADLDLDELRAFCRARLAAYKVPAEFHVVDELPKNASGKVLKRALRREEVRP